MPLSPRARELYTRIADPAIKLGELKKIARTIKRDHDLALELWSTGEYHPRMLATLILDKQQLTQELIDALDADLDRHPPEESNRIMEWLMANQLTKDRRTVALMQSWQHSPSPRQRRTFWYHQARLRWTGQAPPDNTAALMDAIEAELATEDPAVQWAMNFTAAWIGIHDTAYRQRCIDIGEATGLYREEKAVRGCTPNYLPAFIETEVNKRQKA
ncbi:3-methyladenine DNA glycosylase AlkD [Lewinella marina]|uniref:DNA alkylation repair protein n=1 Tax=Neolewinella marina TaxID=438751 RepID=A0A2G0CB93_9BACT|nr:DNA alkylation repair protein [Neolewinella marina]NJB87747.1 3-methyladenine DNA glycosylase AlkD [Neolewinella marina]PHK97220.1 hypothetical protein CGL56_16700 [Neolewinella marina]